MAAQPPAHTPAEPVASRASLLELAGLFLRLGCTAFGGPAVHIAMMEDEVVRRRQWLTAETFVDLLGITSLIPGPNSTELAIHIGRMRAGVRGLLVAGVCFIAPAMLIVLALAWAYVRFGALPITAGVLDGVKPVMLAVITQALWNLGKTAIKSTACALVGLAVIALDLAGVHELALLFGGGLALALYTTRRTHDHNASHALAPFTLGLLANTAPAVIPATLGRFFLAFLRIGGTLYGSGYVLIAFLRNDFVARTHWLTNTQLLDAITVGQVTPGPVFTTATFVGYLIARVPGALVATLGIFLPSFVFVAATGAWLERLRRAPWTRALLDGVNVSALGLMAGVAIQLARVTLVHAWRVDVIALCVLCASAIALVRWKVNATWLLLAGAIAGGVWRAVR